MSDLANPLQALIDQAAQTKAPKVIQKYSQRINPRSVLTQRLLLLDISSSMNEWVGASRKIDLLRLALNRPLAPGERAIAFHSIVIEIPDLQSIPEPTGGTALHLAIAQAMLLKPAQTLVVSDGESDDPQQALAAAKKLKGVISTLYIGDDGNKEAIAFMRELARLGYGQMHVQDLSKDGDSLKLGQAIARLLPPSH